MSCLARGGAPGLGDQRLDVDQRLLLVEEGQAVDLADIATLVDEVNARGMIELAFRPNRPSRFKLSCSTDICFELNRHAPGQVVNTNRFAGRAGSGVPGRRAAMMPALPSRRSTP